MKEKVCLIDGSGYIFRAFFASPRMTNPEGIPVNALYGFINMFLSLTANIKCDYCLVLFDAKRQNCGVGFKTRECEHRKNHNKQL